MTYTCTSTCSNSHASYPHVLMYLPILPPRFCQPHPSKQTRNSVRPMPKSARFANAAVQRSTA